MREAEEVDEPHADEDGGEVLAHEVDGDQVDGEQRAAPGHQLGVDDPVSQVASNQPGQAVGHTTGDTKIYDMKSYVIWIFCTFACHYKLVPQID